MKSNPFATRYVAPGRIEWIGTSDTAVSELAQLFLSKHSCRAAIVGPHGSGKTTLLEHLIPKIGFVVTKLDVAVGTRECNSRNDGITGSAAETVTLGKLCAQAIDGLAHKVVWLNLRGAVPSMRAVRGIWRECGQQTVVVLDGYEQLPIWYRLYTLIRSRQRNCGLLVTSHRPTCLSTLVETCVTPAVAEKIVDKILDRNPQHRRRFMDSRRLRDLLDYHHGNFREVLMTYYDEFERTSSVPRQSG